MERDSFRDWKTNTVMGLLYVEAGLKLRLAIRSASCWETNLGVPSLMASHVQPRTFNSTTSDSRLTEERLPRKREPLFLFLL